MGQGRKSQSSGYRLTADQLSFLHEDLQYSTGYLYAIRALVDKTI